MEPEYVLYPRILPGCQQLYGKHRFYDLTKEFWETQLAKRINFGLIQKILKLSVNGMLSYTHTINRNRLTYSYLAQSEDVISSFPLENR